MTTSKNAIRKITHAALGISEPNPAWFGNGANEKDNKSWDPESKNWLKSRFHYNFAEFSGGRNNFGALRVLNDDLVQPLRGFGTHPHRNAEIMTYIIRGQLTHKDSMGTKESLKPGSIQYMSAASGVSHSEFNDHKSPLRFIQMWVTPRTMGGTPRYGSMPVCKDLIAARQNAWSHLASDIENTAAKTEVKINQDLNLYVAEIDADTTLDVPVAKGRQAYIVALEGGIAIDGEKSSAELEQHEAAELFDNVSIKRFVPDDADAEKAPAKSHVLLLEMARA